MTSTRSDGVLTVCAGRSRMGKSTLIAQRTGKSRRLLVHDSKGDPRDWPRCHVVTSPAVLVRTLRHAGDGPGRYRLVDGQAQHFDAFCRIALAWSREFGPVDIVVDELANVTNPGKAPPGWGQVVRTGLYLGGNIYALTQRPQESDTTCFGNAGELITFHLTRQGDRSKMASELDCDHQRIAGLQPLHYLSRTLGGELVEGVVALPKKRSA